MKKWTFLFIGFLALLYPNYLKAQLSPEAFYFSKGEDLVKKTEKYVFIQVKTEKQEAYTGEGIVAAYHLYVASDIQGKLSKSPSYRGFASYDIEGADANNYSVEKIGGIPFKVYLIKKVQLFGLIPGLQSLEPIELDATIRYRDLEYRNSSLETVQQQTPGDTLVNYLVKSKPLKIKINALPLLPKNVQAGGVGKFEIAAFAGNKTVSAGKADTIYITLKGMGNWNDVLVPKPEWPKGIDVFEPLVTENIDVFQTPVGGLRSMAFPVVSNRPGHFTVPPLHFTYFDPIQKKYQTSSSDSISWEVTPEIKNEGAGRETGKKTDITELFTRNAQWILPIVALFLVGIVLFRSNTNKK